MCYNAGMTDAKFNRLNQLIGCSVEAEGAVATGMAAIALSRGFTPETILKLAVTPDVTGNPELMVWSMLILGLIGMWLGLQRSKFDRRVESRASVS